MQQLYCFDQSSEWTASALKVFAGLLMGGPGQDHTIPSFTWVQHELQHELQQELQQESLYTQVIKIIETKTAGTRDISVELKQKSISGHLKKIIAKLLEQRLIEWTIPETPKSSKQQYKITDRGIAFLQLLHKNKK